LVTTASDRPDELVSHDSRFWLAILALSWPIAAPAVSAAGSSSNFQDSVTSMILPQVRHPGVQVMTAEGANVVLRNAWMSNGRPTEVLFRGPRESLGDPSGLWGKISVGGNRYWVHRYFHSDVRLANNLLAYPDTPPAPQLQ
jgi:hypothetical protein